MAKKKNKHDKASENARDAAHNGSSAQAAQESKSGGGAGRLLFLLFVAGILALVLSEDLRSKVLDMLFGAEEEFDYSSTTMPVQDAPSSVGASS
jgi:hypothetical protein